MLGAGELLGERQLLAVLDVDHDEPVREGDRGLDRLRQPGAQVRLHDQPVDDDLDRVLELLVEDDLVLEHADLSVDLHAREPVCAQLLEDVLVLALAVADDRRVDRELRALLEPQHLVDDRLDRLPGDRPPADRAVRPPDPRVEQSQVVVDLGHGADRRARVARRRLLVDRDRRREALDRVHVRLLHHLEELARVRREGLDVPALALRVDRVEGERRLPGAGQPGDRDQLVPRQADVDVLQVVLAGTVNDELVGRHNRPILPRRVGSNKCSLYVTRRAARPGRRDRSGGRCGATLSGPTKTVPYPKSWPRSDWSISTASIFFRCTAFARR